MKGKSNLVIGWGAQPLSHYPVTIPGNVVLPKASISVSTATMNLCGHTHTLINKKLIQKFF
jgi:hypothetical protein